MISDQKDCVHMQSHHKEERKKMKWKAHGLKILHIFYVGYFIILAMLMQTAYILQNVCHFI